MSTPLLSLEGVSQAFDSGSHRTLAVDNVSYRIATDTPSLVTVAGESGSGKSTLAMMILGFLAPTSGTVRYEGQDIYRLDTAGFRKFRRSVQAVFQNPFETFNPFYPVDRTLRYVIGNFGLAKSRDEVDDLIHSALRSVDLAPPKVLGRFPHQLSGGQLQRISIARAFLVRPRLLVADEPVSMIDASLRVHVLRHLLRLKSEAGTTIIYITHDLSTALQISDQVLIMYRGSIVEQGEATEVIQRPRHAYTKRLISAIPIPDPTSQLRPASGLWNEVE